MLANPLALPFYTHPAIWLLVVVAMWFEVWVVLALLRRMQQDVTGLDGPLGLINLATWIPFCIALDRFAPTDLTPAVVTTVAFEWVVVLVEAALIHALLRRKLGAPNLACQPISWRDALRLSFLGNLASVALSIVVPLLVVLILTARR